MLGDYGADVIKIEDPEEGDSIRYAGPFPGGVPHRDKSGLHLHLNTNKLSMTLDLDTSRGQQIVKELVKKSDILVENFAPGYMESIGLGWSDLEEINPRLIMTSITPFGQTGPYRDYAAEEIVLFALSSRMWHHGMAEREPLRYAPGTVWCQVGQTAAMATMAAVFARRQYGFGQQVDISGLEAMVGNVDCYMVGYSMTGEKRASRTRAGNAASGIVPVRDGYMLLIASGDRFFRRLLQAMGQPELAEDPRFNSQESRRAHQEEFDAMLTPWLLERSKREVFEQLQSFSVMCAPLQTVDEVFTDPQAIAREFFVQIENPEAGSLLQPSGPFKMSETPWKVRRPAPSLGQHTEEVLTQDLGLAADDVKSLRAESVI
jgi:crotonobetainyl-CoA:carnitine CoA-transferase CaiB-like acyl-CoA transferase